LDKKTALEGGGKLKGHHYENGHRDAKRKKKNTLSRGPNTRETGLYTVRISEKRKKWGEKGRGGGGGKSIWESWDGYHGPFKSWGK